MCRGRREMAAERDAFPIPTGHPPRKRGIKLVPTHFIKEETEIPGVQTVWLRHRRYFRHSKTREAPASCTPRRASRRERSQRRFARVVARLEPAGPTRTTPAPSRAPPDTTAGTPSVNNPPSSHRCPRLSRARRRTPETTTTSLSRRGAHDGWHTPPPPPPPIRVRVPPTRTSPDRCARPPSTRLSGRKKISLHHSRGNPTEKKDSAPNCRESQV